MHVTASTCTARPVQCTGTFNWLALKFISKPKLKMDLGSDDGGLGEVERLRREVRLTSPKYVLVPMIRVRVGFGLGGEREHTHHFERNDRQCQG